MNQLAPLNTKQTEYIRKCQASWLNILEGRKTSEVRMWSTHLLFVYA